MGKYDEQAEEAAAETNETLAEGLKKFCKMNGDDFCKHFPDKAERAKVIDLIRQVDKATDNNTFKTAFNKFVGMATDATVNLVRKLVLGA